MKLRLELDTGAAAQRTVARTRRSAALRAACCLGAAIFLLSGCRLDMHIQPKYLPYEPTDFFSDGRSERQPVPGTIARGQLRVDELFYTGKENGTEANEFPFAITRTDLQRGRERYNIYCTPCHDYAGDGNGMIVQRGFPTPPSYHIQRLREAPVGHFFGVMTNGLGVMYSYADRVEPADRWRIAAYIRVLQLSQNATVNDVPDSERQKLSAESPDSSSPGQSSASASTSSPSAAEGAGQPQ